MKWVVKSLGCEDYWGMEGCWVYAQKEALKFDSEYEAREFAGKLGKVVKLVPAKRGSRDRKVMKNLDVFATEWPEMAKRVATAIGDFYCSAEGSAKQKVARQFLEGTLSGREYDEKCC